MKILPVVDLTAPGVVLGRHAAWLPELGVKLPFQFGGRATKYGHREPSYDIESSLRHELAILRALAAAEMAPPVGDLVFFETVISRHPGGWHADPCGAWGYEMADAATLPPGRFSLEAMRALPITGSPNAWGDVEKPGNVVNGYLVDVRRSGFDLLRWDGPRVGLPPLMVQEVALDERVHRECQFPRGERELAYQDFYFGGEWRRGQRRVVERAAALGFAPGPGESVLELGCQAGGFLQLAALAGAETILGVEVEPAYIDCGRALARAARQNICFRKLDAVAEADALLDWVRKRCPNGLDHLLVLSMEKHLGHDALFRLVDALGARRTYIETNAVASDAGVGPEPPGSMKLWPEVIVRGGAHVGNSRDRNLRRLYRIEEKRA